MSTSRYGLPYPGGGDPVRVHTDIQALAEAVDPELGGIRDDLDQVTSSIQIDTTAGTLVTVGGHVVSYDSGWREIAGTSYTPGVVSGSVLIRRTVDHLIVHFRDVVLTAGSGSLGVISGLPTGWRPNSEREMRRVGRHGSATHEQVFTVFGGYTWIAERDTTGSSVTTTRPASGIRGTIQVIVPPGGGLPTSLIGDPA